MIKSVLKTRVQDMVLLTLLVLVMVLPGLAGMPVIDRDEARYAQATVQMIETGDYVNIRFQDRARNKKPAGAYWAQAASVKAFSNVEARKIWAHRIPSVLAAILAILATYWGGVRMLGREAAIIGAGVLAVSVVFVFEAHIAKTDALLCGFSALCLASLGHLRNGGGRRSAVLFWLALSCGVMIKGPLLPMIVLLCVLSLLLWERTGAWLKPLSFWVGPILFLAIVMPWSILIWRETGGAFFTDAIGGDLGKKLSGGQESHGGPPGYYSLSIWAAFWPACLFLLPGLAFGLRAGRNVAHMSSPVARAARLLLCWSIPFFIVLEFIPTKLPHYPLPIFPALALLAGAAVSTMMRVDEFKMARRFSAMLFLVVAITLPAGLLFGQSLYGVYPVWSFGYLGLSALLSIYASVKLWTGGTRHALVGAIAASMLISMPTYHFTLTSLDKLMLARRAESALETAGIAIPIKDEQQIMSFRFTEPSLVYRLGTEIILGKPEERLENFSLGVGDVLILDRARDDTIDYDNRVRAILAPQNLCLTSLDIIDGTNYAKGDKVELDILRLEECSVTSP